MYFQKDTFKVMMGKKKTRDYRKKQNQEYRVLELRDVICTPWL